MPSPFTNLINRFGSDSSSATEHDKRLPGGDLPTKERADSALNPALKTPKTDQAVQPIRKLVNRSKQHSNLDLLWDKATVFPMLAGIAWCIANRATYLNSNLAAPFVLLFVPALAGNLVSIPLCWRPLPESPQARSLVGPSIIVGVVGWLVLVPAASWLISPLLSVATEFRVFREFGVLAFYLVAGELLFYSVHRFLHAYNPLFRLFHAHHHRITNPHVVNASYQHPVELIVITMGTAWIGPLLINGHWTTVSFWCASVMILGNVGHSGDPTIHDEHHRTAHGNYGFLFLDSVLRTLRRPSA